MIFHVCGYDYIKFVLAYALNSFSCWYTQAQTLCNHIHIHEKSFVLAYALNSFSCWYVSLKMFAMYASIARYFFVHNLSEISKIALCRFKVLNKEKQLILSDFGKITWFCSTHV